MDEALQKKIAEAIANPKNMGELENADSVGSVGSANCGDMVRIWLKFKQEKGRKVIDKATFQTFGCETAIAVASMATELIRGKSIDEAMNLKGSELTGDLGPLPPMKIHCGQLVEGALRSALSGGNTPSPEIQPAKNSETLVESLTAPQNPTGLKIVFLNQDKK